MTINQLFAPEAERALLAGFLLDARAVDRVASTLTEADFGNTDHGRLFKAFVLLRGAGRPIGDPVLLVADLQRLGVPESVCSPAYLAGLRQEGVIGHELYYSGIIRSLSLLRRHVALAGQHASRAADPSSDPVELAAWVSAQLDALASTVDTRATLMHDAAIEALAQLEEAAARRGQRGAPTGLPSVDASVGAFMPGDLVVLAARPGIGKTSLAAQVAMHNAERGRPVLFVSLEMTRVELAARHMCAIANVDGRRIRAGDADAEEIFALRKAAGEFDGLPLRIWSPARATLAEVRAIARLEHTVQPLTLLVVDYLGLIAPDDGRAPRHEQVAKISRGLKALAKELSVPVLALCQLTRDADGEQPRLSHLRESGSIEQDADIVLTLHRDDTADGEAIMLDVLKHRHGEIGNIGLRFVPNETRFVGAEAGTAWTP